MDSITEMISIRANAQRNQTDYEEDEDCNGYRGDGANDPENICERQVKNGTTPY